MSFEEFLGGMVLNGFILILSYYHIIRCFRCLMGVMFLVIIRCFRCFMGVMFLAWMVAHSESGVREGSGSGRSRSTEARCA